MYFTVFICILVIIEQHMNNQQGIEMKKENEIKLNRNKKLFSLLNVAGSEIYNAVKMIDGKMPEDDDLDFEMKLRETLMESMHIISRLMDRSGNLRLPK